MIDTDKPWSGSTASSSSAAGSTSGTPATLTSMKARQPGSAPGADRSGVDDARAIFNKMCRELDEREKAAAQQTAGAAMPPSLPEAKPMTPNGDHPHDPYVFVTKHFEEMAQAAEEQRRGQREKDEREAQGRAAAWAELKGEMDAHAKGMEMKALYAGIAQGNAAVEAGYRQLESQTNSGAAQYDRTEDAGWREYHQTEQRGLGQLDRSQTAGERQHESEERRRSSGMSL